MKKLILAATILTIAGLTVQTAKAGDREWATVGKVLTGVAAAGIIINALDCHPAHASVSYTYAAPVCAPARVVYAPQPVCYAPAPVVVYRAPVYYAPIRPFVSVNVGFRGHDRGFRHHRW